MKNLAVLIFNTRRQWALIFFIITAYSAPTSEPEGRTKKHNSVVAISVPPPPNSTSSETEADAKVFKGKATFYHNNFHGKRTASGDLYDKNAFTAAIKQSAIPVKFGTIVEVHNVAKNKTVLVKVNDIMSERSASIIDLSFVAAEQIGLIQAGRAAVVVTIPVQDSAMIKRFEGQGLENDGHHE